jgi:hypothetical protein
VAVITMSTGAAHASAQPAPQWTTIPLASPIESVEGVACPRSRTCIAVAAVPSGVTPGGAILRSSDQGHTWTSVSFSGENGTVLDGVACSAKSLCVAVGQMSAGSEGVIEVSNDDGKSWTRHTTTATVNLYGATCPSASRCVVVGTSSQRRAGIVVSTDDSGRTWHRQGAPSGTSDIDSISCPTTRMCVTAGDKVSAHGERVVISVPQDGERGVILVDHGWRRVNYPGIGGPTTWTRGATNGPVKRIDLAAHPGTTGGEYSLSAAAPPLGRQGGGSGC